MGLLLLGWLVHEYLRFGVVFLQVPIFLIVLKFEWDMLTSIRGLDTFMLTQMQVYEVYLLLFVIFELLKIFLGCFQSPYGFLLPSIPRERNAISHRPEPL